jgi:branched-chain amino acid transport system permease protein
MNSVLQRLPPWLSRRALLGFVGVFVLVFLFPFVLSVPRDLHGLIAQAFIFMSAALAWNWLGGYVGQVSFGHAAMFGIGGFVSAQLLLSGAPLLAAWLLAGVAAALFALLWGHPTLRLRGPYFAIATIGVGQATRLVMKFWTDFTGGSSGVSLPIVSGMQFQMYWYALEFLAVVVIISYWLRKSPIGLGLLAIKEDVEAAGDLGVNASFHQDFVLFLSGLVVGMCGALYASYFSVITPDDMFGFDRSIGFILMAVVGGVGTILGPILGAAVFVLVEETLIATFPDLYLGIYGLLLVLIILFEPLGLSGLFLRGARLVGYRPAVAVAAGGLASSAATVEDGAETPGRSLEEVKT